MSPDYTRDADRARRKAHDEPMSLEEYVEAAFETPTIASHAAKYVLDAIEAAGTRTVVEEGEQIERYRFFDDPHNDGEHAVLGNTRVLNDFVNDLRSVAANRGKGEKIIWFAGPTATGKSELKRCLVNGLREYSKTEAGRRYTLEWNVEGVEDTSGMTYGGMGTDTEEDSEGWYESPVNSHPLSVFPASTRRQLVSDLNDASDDHVPIRVDTEMDPFSREAYDHLEDRYQSRGRDDLFSAATVPQHLRVQNYVMEIGSGIGVLHAEDTGSPKERLVGSWMRELLRELDSRGRKNPQAFSYDGVLSQGNNGLTVLEDAAQHADLLQKLLNVPDERTVKLDKGIQMDIDTLFLIISNLDLETQLNQHADRRGQDPLKALKRRLSKHLFGYLTNLSLEAQLLRRELGGETAVWDAERYEQLAERVREPVSIAVQASGDVTERELAPHAIEAAALFSVVTRLDDGDLPSDISLVEKALLFDRGYLQAGEQRRDVEEFEFEVEAADGTNGIPVTYTRDVVADLLHETTERHHPDLDVQAVLMPEDVLDSMVEQLGDAPVFSSAERSEFDNRVLEVKEYIRDQQERDVLEAIMRNRQVEEDAVSEYVEYVYAWANDESIENDRGEELPPDPLTMKVFETEHLGFSESDYDGNEPGEAVATFRTEKVITAINRHAWEHRSDAFRIDDVDLREIPVIRAVLDTYDWEDVRRTYEDFDPSQWSDPPANTETASLKAETIENMVEHGGYSRASAELTSRVVTSEVSYEWD